MTSEERFWAKVRKEEDCWIWTAAQAGLGYGVFWDGSERRQVYAHRFAYQLLVGPIPEGLQIDHLCRVPLCVNPAHMRVVTGRENILAGNGLSARRARQTHCKRGHEFTPENTRYYRTSRLCKICKRERDRSGSRELPTCRYCGLSGRFYRHEPESYVAWHEWAEKMSRTHSQHRCPGCGYFTVWRRLARVAAGQGFTR